MVRATREEQDALKRALDATRREMSLEERVSARVTENMVKLLSGGFVISRLSDELRGLMRDSMTLSAMLVAVRSLEKTAGFEGLEGKLIALMDGGAKLGADPEVDPGSPPPSDLPASPFPAEKA